MVKATLIIQQWGDSLAVCIPAAIAKSARFSVGQAVEVSLQDPDDVLSAAGEAALSLSQKLAAFDLSEHGGEVMATGRVGVEVT